MSLRDVSLLTSYLAALATSVVIYRLSPFRPLASYPGPVWRRVSMIGPAAATVSGNRDRMFADMHKQYGDIVRTVDPTFVEPLLGAGGLPKGPSTSKERSDEGYAAPHPPIQITTEAICRRRLTQLLVQRLGDQSGSADLGLWLKYFGYDFMCDTAFGGGSELLRNGDKNNVWAIIEEGIVVCTVLHTLPWLGIYLGKIPSVVKPMLLLQENGRQMAKARLERGSKTRDLYHYLCNEDLSDRSPPAIAELADDGILTVVAGSDTASMTMTNVFYCLLTHPEAYAKLQAEIDKFYPAGEPASETKHHRDMHYYGNEALRLYPPVPLGSQRRVPHRRHEDGGFVHNEAAFMPFSIGPMNCPGKDLANLEMRAIIVALMKNFNFRLLDGWDPAKFGEDPKDYFLVARPELIEIKL
ncbi:cytochrome P450 [Lentinus brumalis]|uniref:Cytochrome P450 n=1 Tax=Lentinus brumalis TaxID=2498619 RepID=A0A371DFN8_9APHY|nr:cytochrome P450 [Polyporus brumalis]